MESRRRCILSHRGREIIKEVKDCQQLCYEVADKTLGDENPFKLARQEIFELIKKAGKLVVYVKLNNSMAVLKTTIFKVGETS